VWLWSQYTFLLRNTTSHAFGVAVNLRNCPILFLHCQAALSSWINIITWSCYSLRTCSVGKVHAVPVSWHFECTYKMWAGRGGYLPDEASEYYLCPSLFLCLSPLPHPASFKIWWLGCISSKCFLTLQFGWDSPNVTCCQVGSYKGWNFWHLVFVGLIFWSQLSPWVSYRRSLSTYNDVVILSDTFSGNKLIFVRSLKFCVSHWRGWWITCNYPTVLKEKSCRIITSNPPTSFPPKINKSWGVCRWQKNWIGKG
jgi:hypothetical protein